MNAREELEEPASIDAFCRAKVGLDVLVAARADFILEAPVLLLLDEADEAVLDFLADPLVEGRAPVLSVLVFVPLSLGRGHGGG